MVPNRYSKLTAVNALRLWLIVPDVGLREMPKSNDSEDIQSPPEQKKLDPKLRQL